MLLILSLTGEFEADCSLLVWIAIACYAASCRVHRRPPVSRSAYVSRTAVAAVDLDGEIYRPVPAAVILDNPAGAGARLGGVSG